MHEDSHPDPSVREAQAEIAAQIDTLTWYHTQELGPGLVTPGTFDLRPYVDRYGIPADLSGMRALEVGTFEGFWAFELERRGAEVVAIDLDWTQDMDWPPRARPAGNESRGEGFEMAKRALSSSVVRRGMSVYDATTESLGGQFDLVFIGSVTIHLRDPMLALERLAQLCDGRLIFADEYSRRLRWLPIAAAEFRGETPFMTWWRPAIRTWLSMLRCAGFEDVQRQATFNPVIRGTSKKIPHVVIHARRPQAPAEDAAA